MMTPLKSLGDVCEIIAGQSPPSQYYNADGVGLPFFQGKADFGELNPTVRVWCSQPYKVAEAGDILISVRAPVGPTNLANSKCCIGRGLAAIRPGKDVHTKYLLHYLRRIEPALSQTGRGSTFAAITVTELRNLEIPLPPLPDQRRIAAILDAAGALRAKRMLLLTEDLPAAMRAALEANPTDAAARHALAAHHALAGDYGTALAEWLELMRRDRKFGDDAGRRALLQAFEVLGEQDPLVTQYRRRMASLLH